MVNIDTLDNPYGVQIRNFFQTEFPSQIEKSSSDVLDLLTNAIVASGKVRLGPKPAIESLYLIRQTLKNKIEQNRPIPFLMPWGSEKPVDLQTVDLAEVVALKTLQCLQNRVTAVYSPGIHVRVRVEDASAPSLFPDRMEQARVNATVYTASLLKLNKALGTDSFVTMVPESSMVKESDFNNTLEQYHHLFYKYIIETNGLAPADMVMAPSYQNLKDSGWKGAIPMEQRNHYFSLYRRLYNMNDEEANKTLAIYMAQSLVRRILRMTGAEYWKDFLGLSFVGPVPGEPPELSPKRIYYRTIPENLSTFHIAPWRGKGYLSIGDGLPRVRLAAWSERRNYHESRIVLRNGNESVTVRTDYEVI